MAPCKDLTPNGFCHNPECNQPCTGLYCCKRCNNIHYWKRMRGGQKALEPKPKPVAVTTCTCGDYANCIRCRNAERRRAFKHGDVPAYRLAVIARIVQAGD